jgi:hypothetical protein
LLSWADMICLPLVRSFRRPSEGRKTCLSKPNSYLLTKNFADFSHREPTERMFGFPVGMIPQPGAPARRLNEELSGCNHPHFMRVAMAAIVALLFLNFMDEQFNEARYSRAAVSMAEKMIRSFG